MAETLAKGCYGLALVDIDIFIFFTFLFWSVMKAWRLQEGWELRNNHSGTRDVEMLHLDRQNGVLLLFAHPYSHLSRQLLVGRKASWDPLVSYRLTSFVLVFL